MSRFMRIGVLAMAAAAGLVAAAGAAEPLPAAGEEMDWLVARRDGQWELVSRGMPGRVRKEYANQEVLRLAEDGSSADVLSAPALGAEGNVACSQRARHDVRDACSSSFLVCRADPGSAMIGAALAIFGAIDTATDRRQRLSCRIDHDAVLRAARDVGLIRVIPPLEVPLR